MKKVAMAISTAMLAGASLALGDGDRYRNVYPLLVNTEADRRMRALRPGETPLVLTRCAFPGQTRTACVMWSGDVGNSWKDLRTQIIAGLGFASDGPAYELKYDSPAKVWEEALPLGSVFRRRKAQDKDQRNPV